MISLFGSSYTGEHIFSGMKIVKFKIKTSLTDAHSENSLRIALSQIKHREINTRKTTSKIPLKYTNIVFFLSASFFIK